MPAGLLFAMQVAQAAQGSKGSQSPLGDMVVVLDNTSETIVGNDFADCWLARWERLNGTITVIIYSVRFVMAVAGLPKWQAVKRCHSWLVARLHKCQEVNRTFCTAGSTIGTITVILYTVTVSRGTHFGTCYCDFMHNAVPTVGTNIGISHCDLVPSMMVGKTLGIEYCELIHSIQW